MDQTPYYFFEYDRPPSPKTGRPRKPGRTSWRMTIEHAAQYHPGYRPIMETVEYRVRYAVWDKFQPYEPGAGPKHVGQTRSPPPAVLCSDVQPLPDGKIP